MHAQHPVRVTQLHSFQWQVSYLMIVAKPDDPLFL